MRFGSTGTGTINIVVDIDSYDSTRVPTGKSLKNYTANANNLLRTTPKYSTAQYRTAHTTDDPAGKRPSIVVYYTSTPCYSSTTRLVALACL